MPFGVWAAVSWVEAEELRVSDIEPNENDNSTIEVNDRLKDKGSSFKLNTMNRQTKEQGGTDG